MRGRFALSFVTPLLLQALPVLHLLLGLLLAAWTLAFLLRIVLTWYPQVDLSKGAWSLVAWPTEPVLSLAWHRSLLLRATASRVRLGHWACGCDPLAALGKR